MKTWFHKTANEGRRITRLRKKYYRNGIKISAARVELIIKLKKIKNKFFKN